MSCPNTLQCPNSRQKALQESMRWSPDFFARFLLNFAWGGPLTTRRENMQPRIKSSSLLVACAFGVGLLAPASHAAPVVQAGLTFTEVTAGITLTGASGSGTLADPLVLNETISGGALDEIIQINGLAGIGNLIGSSHEVGFALRKVVTNSTGQTWNFFEHELQEILGTPSENGDGLSFGQGFAAARPFTSDSFTSVNEII